jgi:hypothetical protein
MKYLTKGATSAAGRAVSPWTLTALIAAVIAFYASARSLQIGQSVEVIALTSVAANLAAIVGGTVVFHEPIGSGALATTGRFLAFCLVIAGAALMPAPMRTPPTRPDAWSERRLLRSGRRGQTASTRCSTIGNAPRASTSGPASSTSSGVSCVIAPRRTSATRARARRPVQTPIAGARSCDRWIPGRTPRRGASTAASRCCWWGWRCSSWSSRPCATTARRRRRCSARCCWRARAARRLARDFRAHPANFPDPTSSHGLRMAVTGADGRRRSGPYG